MLKIVDRQTWSFVGALFIVMVPREVDMRWISFAHENGEFIGLMVPIELCWLFVIEVQTLNSA